MNVRHRELNPDTVTHLSTNRARRKLTSLIQTNALPLRQIANQKERGNNDNLEWNTDVSETVNTSKSRSDHMYEATYLTVILIKTN